MKTILIIIAIAFLFSCSEDEKEITEYNFFPTKDMSYKLYGDNGDTISVDWEYVEEYSQLYNEKIIDVNLYFHSYRMFDREYDTVSCKLALRTESEDLIRINFDLEHEIYGSQFTYIGLTEQYLFNIYLKPNMPENTYYLQLDDIDLYFKHNEGLTKIYFKESYITLYSKK